MRTLKQHPLFIISISALMFFYQFGLNNIFNALQLHIAASLKLTPTTMGLVSSLYFYAVVLLLIPAGLLLDRYSPKKIILAALALSICAVIINANSHNLFSLIIARILMGIADAFSFIGPIRIAVNWVGEKQLALSLSLIVSMGILGGFAVQAPLTYIIHLIGWRHALTMIAGIGILCSLLILYWVKDHPHKAHHDAKTLDEIETLKRFKLAFSKKQNFFCGLYVSLMNLPIYMLGAMWGMAYLTTVNTISELKAANICGMIFLGTLIGSPICGFISDALKRRTLPMQIGALSSLILILLMMHYPSNNFGLLMCTYFFLGLLTSTQVLGFPTVVESNSKKISGSATSVISILSLLGGAISQPLFGYVITHISGNMTYAYQKAMWILPIAFLLALALSFFIKETYCQSLK